MKFVIYSALLVFPFIISGCNNNNVNKEDENENDEAIAVEENEEFEIALFQDGDDFDSMYATLTYHGDQESIEIFHYSQFIDFYLEDTDDTEEDVYGDIHVEDELVSTELEQGESIQESLSTENFHSEPPENGEYIMTVTPNVFLDQDDEEEGDPMEEPGINTEIEIENE